MSNSRTSTIETLCKAVSRSDKAEVKRLIEESGVSPNGIDPKTNLRPVDMAARDVNVSMLELLISLGASLSRSLSHRESNIENILIQVSYSYHSHRAILIWFLEPQHLLLLQDEGIKAEHIRAFLQMNVTADDNLSLEDSDGLLPCYYGALAGSPHLTAWIPNEIKNDFLNGPLLKGPYQGTTGAWWLSTNRDSIDVLSKKYPIEMLTAINIYAKPSGNQSPRPGITVLSQLAKYGSGKNLLIELPDEIFFNINWNTKLTSSNGKDVTVAWQMANLSQHFMRLFKLPHNKLAEINWNASPTLKDGETLGSTVAWQIATLPKGKNLLVALPADIINTIDWCAAPYSPEDKSYGEKLIALMAVALPPQIIQQNFTCLLDKFTLEKIQALYNSLDESDPSFPFVALGMIRKLNATISDEEILKHHYNNDDIQDILKQFSEIFLTLKLKSIKNKLQDSLKELNGLKGQIIYRMSITENSATQLLTMSNPFFNIHNFVNTLDNPIDKVKLIAQRYLMKGEKQDKIQGSYITLTFFNRAKEANVQLDTNCLNGPQVT